MRKPLFQIDSVDWKKCWKSFAVKSAPNSQKSSVIIIIIIIIIRYHDLRENFAIASRGPFRQLGDTDYHDMIDST